MSANFLINESGTNALRKYYAILPTFSFVRSAMLDEHEYEYKQATFNSNWLLAAQLNITDRIEQFSCSNQSHQLLMADRSPQNRSTRKMLTHAQIIAICHLQFAAA